MHTFNHKDTYIHFNTDYSGDAIIMRGGKELKIPAAALIAFTISAVHRYGSHILNNIETVNRFEEASKTEPCPYDDGLCPACKEPLKLTPSGWSCSNGHGF